MNTLSRTITARIFSNPNDYTALQKHWGQLMNSDRRHALSAAHHLLYLALRGKDWRKAFTPITNRRKLQNGGYYGWALFRALISLHSPLAEEELLAPFDDLVTSEMLQLIRNFIPVSVLHGCRPEQFATGTFPFEAYLLAETLPATTAEKGDSHD
jgi:hypothetical protein